MDTGFIDPTAPICSRYLSACQSNSHFKNAENVSMFLEFAIAAVYAHYGNEDANFIVPSVFHPIAPSIRHATTVMNDEKTNSSKSNATAATDASTPPKPPAAAAPTTGGVAPTTDTPAEETAAGGTPPNPDTAPAEAGGPRIKRLASGVQTLSIVDTHLKTEGFIDRTILTRLTSFRKCYRRRRKTAMRDYLRDMVQKERIVVAKAAAAAEALKKHNNNHGVAMGPAAARAAAAAANIHHMLDVDKEAYDAEIIHKEVMTIYYRTMEKAFKLLVLFTLIYCINRLIIVFVGKLDGVGVYVDNSGGREMDRPAQKQEDDNDGDQEKWRKILASLTWKQLLIHMAVYVVHAAILLSLLCDNCLQRLIGILNGNSQLSFLSMIRTYFDRSYTPPPAAPAAATGTATATASAATPAAPGVGTGVGADANNDNMNANNSRWSSGRFFWLVVVILIMVVATVKYVMFMV